MKIKYLLFILTYLSALHMSATHIIPESIKEEVAIAMSHYPEFEKLNIEFRFKKNIKKSTMQARPSFTSFFKSKTQRKYVILISEKFKIDDQEFMTTQIPQDVLVGWIAHELGHIMDYTTRNKPNLIWFGLKYLFSENHIVEAERAADTFAVEQGTEEYILKTKDFILNHANITPKYKERIKKYYLSPEEIMDLIENRDKSPIASIQ